MKIYLLKYTKILLIFQYLFQILYFQTLLNININDFKIICDKYKIGERNGKGKEYDINGNLIFEGEYLNGKRSGKGKEYDASCNLIFEGEYLNGLRKGKGKVYNYK